MTRDLLQLADWLQEQGVTHVAMESTGEYWKPVYNILEDLFTLFVVNAHHAKNVPGRKTDENDLQWLTQLMTYGLLAKSFIPPQGQRELREMTRARASMVRERAIWPTACRRRWRAPTSSSPVCSPTFKASPPAPCCRRW